MAEQTMHPLASGSATRAWFHELSSTRGYDLVVRGTFICAILFLALPSAVGVATRVGGHPGAWDLALLADVLARTGVLLFFVLAALLVLVRVRPVSKAHGLQPRLSALAGSFLLMSMALFPRHDLSIGLNLLSAGLIFLGHMLAVFALAGSDAPSASWPKHAAWSPRALRPRPAPAVRRRGDRRDRAVPPVRLALDRASHGRQLGLSAPADAQRGASFGRDLSGVRGLRRPDATPDPRRVLSTLASTPPRWPSAC